LTNKQHYINTAKTVLHWPLFAQPYWLDAVCADWQVFHATINGIDFFVPYKTEKKIVYTFVRNFYLTPYTSLYSSSVVVDDIIWQQAWQAFTIYFKQYHYVQLDQHFLLPTIANNNDNIVVAKYHTNILDTTLPIETLYKASKASLQRHIKFASTQLQITACNNAQTMLDLVSSTAKHRGVYNSITLQQIQQVMTTCAKHNCGIAWQATDTNGIVQAILLQVWDAQCSYSILAANQYPTVFRGAMALLLWHAIQYTASMQIPLFDFEGSRQKGIDDFFKTFGTTQLPVHQLEMFNSKVVKALLKLKKG
jgi:hypothetical protein